jgi:hypothetical protein
MLAGRRICGTAAHAVLPKDQEMVGSSKHEAKGTSATIRTRSEIVNFTHPFSLSAIDERQPAGVYAIETDEEMIGSVAFPAYHRTATWIRLPFRMQHAGAPAGLDQLVNVDPAELEAALARDLAARAEGAAEATGQRPDGREAPGAATSTLRELPIALASRNDLGSLKFTVQGWLDANKSELTLIALALFGLLILAFVMPFDIPTH